MKMKNLLKKSSNDDEINDENFSKDFIKINGFPPKEEIQV